MSSLSQNSQQNSQPLVSRLVNRTTLVFLCVLEELGLPLAEVRSVEPVRQVYSRSIAWRRAAARVPAMALCLPQVGVLLKRMNESIWVLEWKLSSTYPTLCHN